MLVRGLASALGIAVAALGAAVPASANVTCDGPARAGAAGTPELLQDCGRARLDRLAPALGVDDGDLDPVDVSRSPGGTSVRLQQVVDDVPVYGGEVVISRDEAGRVDMVRSTAVERPAISLTPELDAADAVTLARVAVGGGPPLQPPIAELVVYPTDAQAVLAWHVQVPTAEPLADWNAIVDAGDGTVLRAWNAAQRVDGSGLVFDPNPVQTSGNPSAFADGFDLDAASDVERDSVTLTNLAAGNTLVGDYVTNFPAVASEATRIYNYSRADPATQRFEETNVYYAITEAQKKIQALGFNDVNNRSIDVNVRATDQDNSFYFPTTTGLFFGTGGVDDAEDAEVVLHEYGHAVQDNQVPGFGAGDEQGAMGEGFGDFFAAMITLGKGDPAYQAARRYCVADWDATSYNEFANAGDGSGCLRWIDGTDESTGSDLGPYSGTPEEVHDDGRYWSAGMTCIFEGLGGDLTARDQVLKLVIDSHERLVPDDSTNAFEDQIASMIVSDQNMFGGAHRELIRQCAADRNLATLPQTDPGRDTTPPQVAVAVDPPAPDGADGFYTGTVQVTWTVLDPESPVTTSGCGPVTIDSDTGPSGVTLTCTATSAGGVESKSVTIKRRAPSPGGTDADTKAPETTIGKHPRKRSHRRRARFEFSADEPGSSFQCSLDGGKFAACASPQRFRVRPGVHRFQVRATDAAGNLEADAATFSWTVKRPRRR